MARKPLKGYTTPLGSGAGVPVDQRPRAVANSDAILSKPFRVPLAQKYDPNIAKSYKQPVRSVRNNTKSYADMDGGADENGEVCTVDEEVFITMRRKGALCPRRIDVDRNEIVFRKVFRVPYAKGKEDLTINRPPPPSLGTRLNVVLPPRPLHDPTSEFAIVLYDPTVDVIPRTAEEIQKEEEELAEKKRSSSDIEGDDSPNKKQKTSMHKSLAEILGISKNPDDASKKFPNVPVVIDPRLAKILRPHQIAGVKFLYRCTSGLLDANSKGCIMADEMGLGKTLQCLALMWTLLKQSPKGTRSIEKAIIVCPSSLVRNWANEIVKWLGEGVLTPLACDGKTTKAANVADSIRQWSLARGRNIVRPVLIISYETLRRNVDNLAGSEVGLLLADEGHRLKNGESQTFTALNSINCSRRVILSGTPIQNDLSEYFSLLNFANPGLLGTRIQFRKNFENPILRGRDADATDKEREKGDAKLDELSQLVSRFIIRRTNDILSKYLPVKYEHVVFCNLSPLQKTIYDFFLTSPDIKKLLRGSGSQPLKAIGILKKLCNHPDLVNLEEDIEGCGHLIPDDYQSSIGSSGRNREIQTWYSGKFSMLERFLAKIKKETNDKIVLISNYTQTLDLVEKMCRSRRYGSLRLDGSMNINKRQKIVDKFNNPEEPEFVFLLSSKAGGCGINLIGANRLVLMDPDWNPASDQQALARVWRDGQKKDCFIYRFISTGTIEEKIFQRQSMKLSLSSCVVDEKEDVERLFSADLLKQLFQFCPEAICDTHDTYNCKRCVNGEQKSKSPAMLYGDATSWNHINHEGLAETEDILLRNEHNFDDVSFTFQYVSH